jgi:hypothetical protein
MGACENPGLGPVDGVANDDGRGAGTRIIFATSDDVPDALALYRRILAARPDQSVTIVVVAWLANMADLLNSKPD